MTPFMKSVMKCVKERRKKFHQTCQKIVNSKIGFFCFGFDKISTHKAQRIGRNVVLNRMKTGRA